MWHSAINIPCLAISKHDSICTKLWLNTSKGIVTLIVMLFALSHAYGQFKIPEKPKFQTSVYDSHHLLDAAQKKSLEQKLITYSDTTSTQIVIAIISSTHGENINYLGAQWGEAWGIGQAEKDNGILIILAHDDKKIAINTGYGVEHLLTDAMSKRIIERDIIPYFKLNDYYGGLNRGSDAIFEVLTGAYKGTRNRTTNEKIPKLFVIGLVFLFIIILISISKNKRNGGGRGGNRRNNSKGMSILDAIILSNLGRGSYSKGSSGGGWSSGGGFGGGFGGGGFGGGGASGGW